MTDLVLTAQRIQGNTLAKLLKEVARQDAELAKWATKTQMFSEALLFWYLNQAEGNDKLINAFLKANNGQRISFVRALEDDYGRDSLPTVEASLKLLSS